MDRESNYKTHGGGPSTQLVTNNKTSSTLAAANSAIIPHKVKNLRDYITNRNNKEIPLDKEVPQQNTFKVTIPSGVTPKKLISDNNDHKQSIKKQNQIKNLNQIGDNT